MDAEKLKEARERLRFEVETRPNTRVYQIHRNEWPRLWEAIDAVIEEDDEDTWIGNPEDMPVVEEIPEVPMVATFDENDELVEMEELPEIPEPGEKPDDEAEDKNHPNVITSGPIPPPARRKVRDPETYDEFSLPENPE